MATEQPDPSAVAAETDAVMSMQPPPCDACATEADVVGFLFFCMWHDGRPYRVSAVLCSRCRLFAVMRQANA